MTRKKVKINDKMKGKKRKGKNERKKERKKERKGQGKKIRWKDEKMVGGKDRFFHHRERDRS